MQVAHTVSRGRKFPDSCHDKLREKASSGRQVEDGGILFGDAPLLLCQHHVSGTGSTEMNKT